MSAWNTQLQYYTLGASLSSDSSDTMCKSHHRYACVIVKVLKYYNRKGCHMLLLPSWGREIAHPEEVTDADGGLP